MCENEKKIELTQEELNKITNDSTNQLLTKAYKNLLTFEANKLKEFILLFCPNEVDQETFFNQSISIFLKNYIQEDENEQKNETKGSSEDGQENHQTS